MGAPLLPSSFPDLIQQHPQGVEVALALEAKGRTLSSGNLSRKRLSDFIQSVCEWGGYPKTAERLVQGNPWASIREQFGRAIAALEGKRPNVRFAVRELCRLRYLAVSFASKHLRFLKPEVCPVLDGILSQKLGYPLNPRGYGRFSSDCQQVADVLQEAQVENPFSREAGAWFAAEVEMALYVHVKKASAEDRG
jgi:hypothetical protein